MKKMETCWIAEWIIKKHERSLRDWREGEKGNRSLKIQEEDIRAAGGYDVIKEEALYLEKEGLINRIQWVERGFDVGAVYYTLDQVNKLYLLCGTVPKAARLRKLETRIRLEISQTETDWVRAFLEELLTQIKEGKEPPQMEDSELLACLRGLDRLRKPVFKRIFSKYCLGGSKVFENRCQKKIISLVRRYSKETDDSMTDSEVLQQIFIEEYSQELLIKGELILEIEGKRADFSVFPYGAVLNAQTMERAVILPGQRIGKVVTVENKANFMSMPYTEGTLYIFTHGYLSPREREFLGDLRLVLEKQERKPEYFHTGDLDYGGIMIFRYMRQRVFPEIRPFLMSAEVFEKYEKYGEPAAAETLKKVARLKRQLEGAAENDETAGELAALAGKILETGLFIEQESFLTEGVVSEGNR